MDNNTLPHFKLQDGSCFNFKSRLKKRYIRLVDCFKKVGDGRSPSGLRHPLVSILFMLFCGVISGCKTMKECHAFGVAHEKWLKKFIPLPYGIPDATTLSRALARIDPIDIQKAWRVWMMTLGIACIASADGKTMCGIQKGGIRHILSLLSHDLQIIGQEGVDDKENEIPAFYRLLTRVNVKGMLLVLDALHTQTKTVDAILSAGADYLLQVKRNQKTLHIWMRELFNKQAVNDYTLSYEQKSGRNITTMCMVITDPITVSLFHSQWKGVKTLVCIHRYGTRYGEPFNEWVYAISSQCFSARKAWETIRHHWKIENNLHWRKDTLYQEDHLKGAKGAQILTFMRSMAISLIESVHFKSFSDAVHGFNLYPTKLHQFMECMEVI